MRTTVTDPLAVLEVVVMEEKMLYVLQLLFPVAFLSLGSPLALIGLPVLAFNLLSTFYYQYHLEYHYHSLLIPVLWASATFTLGRIDRLSLRFTGVATILLATLISAYLWGPMHWARIAYPEVEVNSRRAEVATEMLEMIPQDAAVSAWYVYSPHLTHRKEIYDFPNPWHAYYWGDYSMTG